MNNVEAVQEVLWQQIKTLSALIERIEKEGDRLQELYRQAEHEREQKRTAVIEQYLRKRLEVEPGEKKGVQKGEKYKRTEIHFD